MSPVNKIPSVSIITPVWNQCHLTERFLAQHWAIYAGWPDIEWVIVDNGSTDKTGFILGDWKHTIDYLKHVRLEKNTGFGPGNNLGAEIATGAILIFLSNDVQILGDYITPIRRFIAANPEILYGAEIFSHNTGWNTFKETGSIAYVAGWCVVTTRQLWKKVGPWDERFIPCDYEDVDLSYNAQLLGYRLGQIDLPLKHDSGKSAIALPGGRQQITFENRERFIKKWGLTLE